MNVALPRISVITPSYNQGQYLEETIQSVLSQRYPELEYIIMDGGSRDNSVEIIRKYGHTLAYWESVQDKGFGHAINKGFSRATGEILCWLNSDDILLPGALLAVGKYFASHRQVGLVFGDRHIINEKSELLYKRNYFFYLPGQFRFGKALPQECTFWRRSAFEKAGSNLNEELKFAIDFDLWCRLSKVTAIRHIPIYLGAFRDQQQSKSSTLQETGIAERDKIIRKYFGKEPSRTRSQIFHWWLTTLRRAYRFAGILAWKRRKYRKELC